MKNYLRTFLVIIGLCLGHLSSHSQDLTSIGFTPTSPLECNPISVTADGILLCINAIFDSTNHVISGNVINVNVYYTQPFICLPALGMFSHTEIMPSVPAGTYTLNVNSLLNLSSFDVISTPITVGSCCSVNTSFSVSDSSICVGDSITFSVADTSYMNYSWKVGGTVVSTDTQFTEVFSTGGSYMVELVIDDGCKDSTQFTVFVSDPLISFPSVGDESCPGMIDGFIDMQVTGGASPYTYLWSNAAMTQDISMLDSGTYSVSVVDNIGCTDSDSVFISAGIPVTAGFSSTVVTTACKDDTTFLTSTSMGATIFAWYNDGQLFSAMANPMFVFTDTGLVDIMLIASNATCSDTINASFIVFDLPTLSTTAISASCASSLDGSIDLQVSGGTPGYSFLWSTSDTTEDLSSIGGGSYTVVVTDVRGCMNTITDSILIDNSLVADFSSNTATIVCPGDTLTLTNTSAAATSYSWSLDGQMFDQTMNTSVVLTDTGSAEITLIATDGVCSDTTRQTFKIQAPPQVSAALTDPTCPADTDGAIDLTVNAGLAPFSYDWSNGSTDEDLSELGAGVYSVIVTDSAGCVTNDTLELVPIGGLDAEFDYSLAGIDIQFNDLSDSTATTWFWDFGDGNTAITQNPLYTYAAKGTYPVCLKVTDALGCVDSTCQVLDVTLAIDPELIFPAKIYPNPTSSIAFIELPEPTGMEIKLSLYDALGRKVVDQRLRSQTRLSLDISSLAEGMYNLMIETNDRFYQAQLIKQ